MDRVSRSSAAPPRADSRRVDIRLSEVISALSYALDVTEGQPMGHAVRSCAIGMRIGEEIGLDDEQRSSLFYALLLKDAGCSSNAAKLSALFGADDFELKRDRKLTNHHCARSRRCKYLARHARTRRLAAIARSGAEGARAMTELRCERGAEIARMIELTEATAEAIKALDEHWDGHGYPYGLAGDEIPLLGRIVCLAQTAEVFFAAAGPRAVFDVAAERCGTWFDPTLVAALRATRRDREFWSTLGGHEPHAVIGAFEPQDRVQTADSERLDRVAEAFALIIDAKSPYTGQPLGRRRPHRGRRRRRARLRPARAARPPPHGAAARHRQARRLQPDPRQARQAHRRGVDADAPPPGAHRPHPRARRAPSATSPPPPAPTTSGSTAAATTSAWGAEQLNRDARILAVADVCEALTADRPYRKAMEPDRVRAIMRGDAGTAFCPEALGALEETRELGPVTLATPVSPAAPRAAR